MSNIIEIDRPITEEAVNRLNTMSTTNTNLVIELKNTKGQNKEIIKRLNPNITISILGEINYHQKEKYNDKKYIDRTKFSPSEVYQIINQFERLERGINPKWTDKEKAIYIYKILAENMHPNDDVPTNKNTAISKTTDLIIILK